MTMNCCLICFRLVSCSENDFLRGERENERLKVFQRFFKMLNRHLRINGAKINSNDDVNKTTVFSDSVNLGKVLACEECLKVMSSFCEVYHKIKYLELILDQKMRTLMSIMFCAGKVPARVACFKETFLNKLDTSGPYADKRVNEILQYKKLLIAKCSEKLSGTYPKLVLEKIAHPMEKEGQNKVISREVSSASPTIASTAASATAFEEEVKAPTVESIASSQMDIADCFEDFAVLSSPIEENALLGLSCNSEASDKNIQMSNSNIQEDEIYDEFSIEMEDVKPNHVSTETKAIIPSTRRSLRTIYKCNKCARTFSSLNKLSNHQSSQNCEDTLGKQSKVESDSENEPDNLPFKTGNDSSLTNSDEEEVDAKPYLGNQIKGSKVKSRLAKRRKIGLNRTQKPRMFLDDICPICRNVISAPSNSSAKAKDELISQHILQEHPEAFKTPGTPQPFSCPVFYCPFAFDNVRSLKSHCSSKHKAEFKLRLRHEKQDYRERDLEHPLHCPFPNCDAACLTRAILTIHLKSVHESEWNPKNLTILSRKFFKDRMISMKKTVKDSCSQLNESDLEGEKEDESKLKKLILRTKCPECCEIFSHFYEMILHRKKIHLDSNEEKCSLPQNLTIHILNLRKETSEDEENDIYLKIEIGSSKVFSCPDGNPPCEQLFLFQEDLEAHRKLHGEFKCKSCDVVEENAVKLAEHELQEHTNNGDCVKDTDYSVNLSCPRCEEKFCRKYKYLEHFVTEHLNLERLMEQCCPICRDTYGCQSWTSEMKTRDEYRHLFKYHNLLSVKDPDIYRCKEEGCFAYFLNSNQLQNHTRIVHSFEKNPREFRKTFRIKCKDCGKVFKRKNDLRLHRVRVHVKDSDKISCTVEGCQQKFEFEKELTSHLKLIHTRPNRFQIEICSKCGKSFKGIVSFRQHMAAHLRKEKAEADGQIAQSWVCESCGKGFKAKPLLETHILLRHKGPESWRYQCKVCNKKCLNLPKLNEHMRIHTNEKPFICQVCGAAYGHRHNLRIHVNNKHGDVIQDIPKKRDTSNLFRRKSGETIKKKVKKKRVLQEEAESD